MHGRQHVVCGRTSVIYSVQVLEHGAELVKNMENSMQQSCQMSLLNFSLSIDDSNLYHFEGVDYSQTPTKTLYIRGIDTGVTEDDIRQCFEQYGDVKKVCPNPSVWLTVAISKGVAT